MIKELGELTVQLVDDIIHGEGYATQILKEWAESIIDECVRYAKVKDIEMDGYPGDWASVVDKESIQLVKSLIK